MKTLKSAVAGLLFCASMGSVALAEDLSTGTIKIIVPFNAGGSLDPVVRLMAEYMAEELGGPNIIVENKPGAGGIIGAQALLQGKPDGRTLIAVSPSHALNTHFYKELPYDTFNDFTPISLISIQGNVMIASPNSPYETVQDVVDVGKSAELPLQYGVSGIGTSNHLGGVLLGSMADIPMEVVLYTGGAATLTGVMGDQVPMGFASIAGSLGQIESGGVRALAVTSSERNPQLPDVPTMAEAGIEGYEAINWWGVLAPAGLDDETLKTLHDAIDGALTNPELQEKLAALGVYPTPSTPEKFDAFIRSENEKWGPILEEIGIEKQ